MLTFSRHPQEAPQSSVWRHRQPTLRLFCWANLDLGWSSARACNHGSIDVDPPHPTKKKKKNTSHQNNSVWPESSRLGSLEPAGSASSDGQDYRMMAVEGQVGPAGRIERNARQSLAAVRVQSRSKLSGEKKRKDFFFLSLPSFFASGVKYFVPASWLVQPICCCGLRRTALEEGYL